MLPFFFPLIQNLLSQLHYTSAVCMQGTFSHFSRLLIYRSLLSMRYKKCGVPPYSRRLRQKGLSMKKLPALILTILLSAFLPFLLTACGNAASAAAWPVDVDLTNASANIVYSTVYNLKEDPASGSGKTMALTGQFTSYEVTSVITGKPVRFCSLLIEDQTKCCSQSVEFIWNGEHSFPDDYPSSGAEVTVTGTCTVSTDHGYDTFLILADDVSVR